jgi:bacterioferritin
MKGSSKVIQELNAALSAELTAIVQYMVQAEMCDNWGYTRLGALTKKRAFEEMHHAEGLIERLLYLDSAPEVDVTLKPRIGKNVKAHLEIDLKDEIDAGRQYNAAIAVCRREGDEGSRKLFETMIQAEERHVDFLESQLSAIAQIGLDKYLSMQLDGEEEKA